MYFLSLGMIGLRIMQSGVMIALKFLAICPPTKNQLKISKIKYLHQIMSNINSQMLHY